MQKFLMVTKKPNDDALELHHDELFDLGKNPFSQFFGRALLGHERDVRQFFNPENFLWMHAKGSRCHGAQSEDGPEAIRKKVLEVEFKLIVTFGDPAYRVFFKKREDLNTGMVTIITQHLHPLELWKTLLVPELQVGTITSPIVCLPHPSGRAQGHWMEWAQGISDAILATQDFILKSIRDGQS